MSTDAVSNFISGLAVHFGEPKFDVADVDKPEAHREWLRAMVRNFGGYSDAVLQRACDLIVANRTYRTFPLISECKKAVIEADKQDKAENPRLIGSQPNKNATYDDRERLAMELILGSMGKRAGRENWIGMLYEFTRNNMRLPQNDAEINHLIRESRLADKDYEKLLRNDYDIHPENALQWTKMRGALIQGWDGRFAKRKSLTEYVQTGVMP